MEKRENTFLIFSASVGGGEKKEKDTSPTVEEEIRHDSTNPLAHPFLRPVRGRKRGREKKKTPYA